MIFESLNNNVMLVELSDDEMKTYNITYESLNNQDADTQIAIRKLLDHIDNKNSIKTGGKVVVEALPIDAIVKSCLCPCDTFVASSFSSI